MIKLRAAGPALALAALASVSLGALPADASSHARPPARVEPLKPRTQALTPRIEALTPRTESLTPRVRDLEPKPKKSPTSTTFTINSDVLFAFNEYTLSPDARSILSTVVNELHTAKAGTVTIVGYTDDIGKKSYNLTLSVHRAQSVDSYLSAHDNNRGLRYKTEGMGEADPVAPNKLPDGKDNPAGRRQNRRVVITYKQG